ncbi:MAG: type I restriction enzyme HsdR N-terminal domain-containing protein [Chitinophagaceae bacterium]
MIPVQFPAPQFKMKTDGDKRYIFDAIRKTWLLLTEEEWVRQSFVDYLVRRLEYPPAMIALEKGLELNGLKKRFDILVYNSNHQPWLMVECKAPEVALSEDVLQQVLRYNISIPVEYIIITNGEYTMGWRKEGDALQRVEEMPLWR